MLMETLNDLWESAWNLLLRGQSDPKSAFTTPVVATVSPDGNPHSRTLVLRKVLKEKGELWCYTDRRSQKAIDISEGSGVMSWTFWDPKKKVQVNARGPTTWLNEAAAQRRFQQLPKHSRKAYATLAAPGSQQADYSNGLPEDWEKLAGDATEYAAEYFGILCTTLVRVEILHLRREGHQRMLAKRSEDGVWQLCWLVP